MNPSDYRDGKLIVADGDEEFYVIGATPDNNYNGYHHLGCEIENCSTSARLCLNPTVVNEKETTAYIALGNNEEFLCDAHFHTSSPNPIKPTHDQVINILLKHKVDPFIVAEISDAIEGLLDKEPSDVLRPVTCPTATNAPYGGKHSIVGCGSTNVVGPDHEGLYDCCDCGIFFDPER